MLAVRELYVVLLVWLCVHSDIFGVNSSCVGSVEPLHQEFSTSDSALASQPGPGFSTLDSSRDVCISPRQSKSQRPVQGAELLSGVKRSREDHGERRGTPERSAVLCSHVNCHST